MCSGCELRDIATNVVLSQMSENVRILTVNLKNQRCLINLPCCILPSLPWFSVSKTQSQMPDMKLMNFLQTGIPVTGL